MAKRWPEALFCLCLAVYLVISLSYLSVFPAVGEDEPWIAAAPYKLATQGVYGSDLFAGYYGNERHNYQHMPVYPLLQAAVFAVAGTGVVQMRALPVAFGFLLLVVVFLVGRQAAGPRAGALAVVLLLVLRIADGAGPTGILLLDRARINRYDIAVPVFGLFALWLFLRAERRLTTSLCLWIGILIGLSSLSHLHGIFWLPVILLALLVQNGPRTLMTGAPWVMTAGVALTWIPWVAYIATGWEDFLGQMRFLSPRFELFSAAFYRENVFGNTGPLSVDWHRTAIRDLPAARIGTWVAVIGLPAALVSVLWQARRAPREDRSLPVAVALSVLIAAFIVLIRAKGYNYMVALWPVGALVLAIGAVRLWDVGGMLGRAGLALVIGALAVEGLGRVNDARVQASNATPYEWYTSEIARCIPPGSLVLGLQHYWLGLRQFPYRTWLVPVHFAHPLYAEDPVTLDQSIADVSPDVILVDRYIDTMLRNARNPAHDNHPFYLGFQAYIERHQAQVMCVIRDRTYGMMRVYRVPHLQ